MGGETCSCGKPARWLVRDRCFCGSCGITESIRGSVAMRQITHRQRTVWDSLELRLAAESGADALRDIAAEAIEAGRAIDDKAA